MCRCLELAGTVSPFISMARPVYHSSCSAAPSMSAFILVMVLPVSITSVRRSSSPRSRMRLATALRYFPRSLISSAAQAGCAFSAAATALLTSDASPATNSPIRSSLAGLPDSIHLLASPAMSSPPISICPFIWACTFMTNPPGILAARCRCNWRAECCPPTLYRGYGGWTSGPPLPLLRRSRQGFVHEPPAPLSRRAHRQPSPSARPAARPRRLRRRHHRPPAPDRRRERGDPQRRTAAGGCRPQGHHRRRVPARHLLGFVHVLGHFRSGDRADRGYRLRQLRHAWPPDGAAHPQGGRPRRLEGPAERRRLPLPQVADRSHAQSHAQDHAARSLLHPLSRRPRQYQPRGLSRPRCILVRPGQGLSRGNALTRGGGLQLFADRRDLAGQTWRSPRGSAAAGARRRLARSAQDLYRCCQRRRCRRASRHDHRRAHLPQPGPDLAGRRRL